MVLIGDAAHATTPHLASGAGMAIEDGIVLTEEIQSKPTVPAALQGFMDRRFERCRLVVENSVKLGQIEMNHGSPQEHTRLMSEALSALRRPI
jgi:2-polyprenyl-6-methoxyphenol hydroxylase-like FAD-dependent oxidoreductase